MNVWGSLFYANRNAKNAGVAIVISEKIDFRTKAIRTEKDAFISHNESGINKRKGYHTC